MHHTSHSPKSDAQLARGGQGVLLLRGAGEGKVVPGTPCTHRVPCAYDIVLVVSMGTAVPGYTAQQSTAGTTAVVPQRYT